MHVRPSLVVLAAFAALTGCGVSSGPAATGSSVPAVKGVAEDAPGAQAPAGQQEPPPPPAEEEKVEEEEVEEEKVVKIEKVDFRPIFDGKTLDGWSAPDMGYWSVEDGAIVARATDARPVTRNQFLVWRQGELDDFELKLAYRIRGGPQANSGVQIRSRIQEDGHAVGYQADIDSSGGWAGALYDEHGRGPLARRGQKAVIDADGRITHTSVGDADALWAGIRKDDWNDYHITARGTHITLEINGNVTAEVIDDSAKDRDLSGSLALQLHSGPPMTVEFRDIRLKRLKTPGRRKVVFLAGPPSHGYGLHEHYAGSALLARLLNENVPNMRAVVHREGWPRDPTAFDDADAVVVISDGDAAHVLAGHLDEVDALLKKGVGLACIHYAVGVTRGRAGNLLRAWIGGYYEEHWSVNPTWEADFKAFPDHPVTRGVRPFRIKDEWYYHMRFLEGMRGVTPVLTAVPPERTRQGPDGPHSGNPHVRARAGMAEHLAWAHERPGGGRGFGITGGHWHWNWAHDDFRRLVLNALVWVAGAEVPEGGVASPTPTVKELEADQDEPGQGIWNAGPLQKMIDGWNRRAD